MSTWRITTSRPSRSSGPRMPTPSWRRLTLYQAVKLTRLASLVLASQTISVCNSEHTPRCGLADYSAQLDDESRRRGIQTRESKSHHSDYERTAMKRIVLAALMANFVGVG